MTDLIRSAALTHYPDIARSVGLDPNEMMRRARVPLACLDRPEVRIAVTGFRRLLETSAAVSGAQDFGLRMADRGGLTNLGPVALVVREQPTVGSALEALARYIHIHHDGMRLDVERSGSTVTIALGLRGRHPSASNQSIDLGLGTVHRVIKALCGDKWRPLEVHFSYAPPRDRSHHREFFGCPLVFNSEIDAVVISAQDLGRRIASAHPLMASYLRKRVEAIDTRPGGWDEKVDEVVRALLASGNCTVERVAEHFACNRRTIHRHLAECGTSFSAILDMQRAALVTKLIEDPGRSLSAIAQQLGFSAQSAMARWFRSRFGCSITDWRKGVRPAKPRVDATAKAGGHSARV
ncbi:AraC family transcriptional regulator [Bradyrhizobium liaoningense]|uniref:AraC family transcriptional regulator n=1 Tax=Bradyrhizobium liaoningense TaxID=43992 RepID=UPI001BA72BBE|nr:AraC family transcriptional regulator [Bradyrhizobium liaoningense]MBR0717624.1 AraC family transcriptional regulator [Bradyrhizobium liaoningense]